MSDLPEYVKQGDVARLFPVLADTSREKRIASIFLSLLPQVPALAEEILATTGLHIGKRTRINAYTEVVLKEANDAHMRPDGLLVVSSGKTSWSALIEAKIGKSKLDPDQIQSYLEMARASGIDAVITISNEFVARADLSPVSVSKTLLRKTKLYHWSWMWITTQCEILIHQEEIEDDEQAFLLDEFLRFLNHPGTGVERFSQMGPGWKNLVQSVANQGNLLKSSPEVEEGVACWFEEERDLSLQLSRHIGQPVEVVIARRLIDDPAARLKAGINHLAENLCLVSTFRIPDSAADVEVCADLTRKTFTASMKIKAPLDRKSTKARLNWLLRMLKKDDPRIIIRAYWPGRASTTQKPLHVLREDPSALQTDNKNATPHSFEVLFVEGTGKRFAGRRTFIEDVERTVPAFYDLVGQYLRAWQAPPPRPVPPRSGSSDDEIADGAGDAPQPNAGTIIA